MKVAIYSVSRNPTKGFSQSGIQLEVRNWPQRTSVRFYNHVRGDWNDTLGCGICRFGDLRQRR